MRKNEEAEFNKLNFNKITSGIFSEINSVLNLKFMKMLKIVKSECWDIGLLFLVFH